MSSDSRERMVRSAASLIRTRGVNATSFSEVLADSGAPRGSIYHHFPAGKKQLAEATLAGMEGALILCRAEGNAKPLDTVAEELLRLLPPAASRPVPSGARRRQPSSM